MKDPLFFIIARSLHILGVILWIGGVSFVTTVLIPAIRKMDLAEKQLELFEKLEGRFSLQAKFSTLLTGLSGFYMIWYLDAWSRYMSFHYWWMHMMTLIWLIFTIVLFILEPLFLHKWFHQRAKENPEKTFKLVYQLHLFLLILSLIAVVGAVAGTRGFSLFEFK